MLVFLLWFIVSIIDSSIWMLFGTIISPILLFYHDPKEVIPAILLSQWLYWIISSIRHHRNSYVDFSISRKSDLKFISMIILPWLIASILGFFIAIKVNGVFIRAYIWWLVFLIWILILKWKKINFSNGKMMFIWFLSSFNKILTWWWFWPFITWWQIFIWINSKRAIAMESLSKSIICLFWFLLYYLNNWNHIFNGYIFYLIFWSIMGWYIGPSITKKVDNKKLSHVLWILLIILWIISLLTIFFKSEIKI